MRTDIESFLKKFHRRYPSCTPKIFSLGKTENELTSYEEVLHSVGAPLADAKYLDLACGDGFLLQAMANRGFTAQSLWGIDMSEGELEVAYQQKSLLRDHLLLRNAADLPFENKSIQAITCHMAFMLMPELNPILAEISRVLKPGGVFVALIGGRGIPSPANDFFGERLLSYLGPEKAGSLAGLSDKRTHSVVGIQSLFSPENGFQRVSTEDLILSFQFNVDEAVLSYMETYYVGLLSEENIENLAADLRNYFHKIVATQGALPTFQLSLRKIVATKA